MATKSLLNKTDLPQAHRLLRPPPLPPDGDLDAPNWFSHSDFSSWLGLKLETTFSQWPEWSESSPIALGSWARGELCPASDLDLLFCGDEAAAHAVIRRLQEQGYKARCRIPESLSDWSLGVEPFDVLALFHARPFSRLAAEKLRVEQIRLRRRGEKHARDLLLAMSKERDSRQKRYDSISSFLEPNLKYGHGGLRDLEQALAASRLAPRRFPSDLHALRVLAYYKAFFLTCRQKLQLQSSSSGDVLAAGEQASLAEWFGYGAPGASESERSRDFMRQIERGLARVSFYADWIFAQCAAQGASERASKAAKLEQRATAKKLSSPTDLFAALRGDPSIFMQARVRGKLEAIFGPPAPYKPDLSAREWKAIGKSLRATLSPSSSEDEAIALFRSRLIDRAVPGFARIVGHVQHDQYHRFSVDAHILQAVREAKRARKNPKASGRLQATLRRIDRRGWEALSWAALYHDLAKGLPGDHSVLGVSIAKEDLKRFGVADSMIDDVAWLVASHLALSAAAFRRNPRAPETWQALARDGVVGRRLDLLAAFTYIDIRATNPEAWNSWKETLLADLVDALRSPEASATVEFLQAAGQGGLETKTAPWIASLDPVLIELLPRKAFLNDLSELASAKETLSPLIVAAKTDEVWIRFHDRVDRPGLFLEFVETLRRLGLAIKHASAQTVSPAGQAGAYDWFLVKTTKSRAVLSKLLSADAAEFAGKPSASISDKKSLGERGGFEEIELVSAEPSEWTLSFRGPDRPGALSEAARALFSENLEIRWARVHTWGRQIDDVFGVSPSAKPSSEVEAALRKRLGFGSRAKSGEPPAGQIG